MGRPIYIDSDLLNSHAFRKLTKSALVVLLDFFGKRKVMKQKGKRRTDPGAWITINNGQLVYTYREAGKKGMATGVFRDAIDELVERGFTDIARPGSGYGRQVTLYGLSERWRNYGTDKFIIVHRQKDTRQGRGFSCGNKAWAGKGEGDE